MEDPGLGKQPELLLAPRLSPGTLCFAELHEDTSSSTPYPQLGRVCSCVLGSPHTNLHSALPQSLDVSAKCRHPSTQSYLPNPFAPFAHSPSLARDPSIDTRRRSFDFERESVGRWRHARAQRWHEELIVRPCFPGPHPPIAQSAFVPPSFLPKPVEQAHRG
ncbi:hypothetical protein C8F01DRAFT_207610 [Mycena amicta]|nr:hypothetical protein C8F01DRAFT_207610 [Mycena amicta]